MDFSPASGRTSPQDSDEGSHSVVSEDASPLSPSVKRSFATKEDTIKPYDREDSQAINEMKKNLKDNGCQYTVHERTTELDLNNFNLRHLMITSAEWEDAESKISLLHEDTINKAGPEFTQEIQKKDGETPRAQSKAISPQTEKIILAMKCLMRLAKSIKGKPHTAHGAAIKFEPQLPFINPDMRPMEIVTKMLQFLAHPLHFHFGRVEDGAPYGIHITREDILDLYEGIKDTSRDQIASELLRVIKTEISDVGTIDRITNKVMSQATSKDIATYAHRLVMAYRRTTSEARETCVRHRKFLTCLKESLEVFRYPKESCASPSQDRTDLANVVISLLESLLKPQAESLVSWRALLDKVFEAGSPDIKLETEVGSCLSTNDFNDLVKALNDEEGQKLLERFPNNNESEYCDEVSGNVQLRGTALRGRVVEMRLAVILKHLTSLHNDLRIEEIFDVAPKFNTLVIKVQYGKEVVESILFVSQAHCDNGETVTDIGFRVDGKFIIEEKSQHLMTVRFAPSHDSSPIGPYGDETPEELLKRECIIEVFDRVLGKVRIHSCKDSNVTGYKTEMDGQHPLLCKPRLFMVKNTPCRRVALLWDSARHNATDRISETAIDIAKALDYEHDVVAKYEAGLPAPPLPDLIRVSTTKPFRKSYLPKSDRLFDEENRLLAAECPLAKLLINDSYWLLFLPDNMLARKDFLRKAKFIIKRESADQQSFNSKIQEILSFEQEGNVIIFLTLNGDVSVDTFRGILALEKTTLRVIMPASAATYRLYKEVFGTRAGSEHVVYTPEKFYEYAKAGSSTLSALGSSSLSRIVSTPPKAIPKDLLINTFIDFVKRFARATALTNVMDFGCQEDGGMKVVLLTCNNNAVRERFFNQYHVTAIDSDKMANEVPNAVGVNAMIEISKQQHYIRRCGITPHCQLVVVWSETRFRSDIMHLYSASHVVTLRSNEPVAQVDFNVFVDHFPLCQLLNRPACEKLWTFYSSENVTKDYCSGPHPQPVTLGGQWPSTDWSGVWSCSYQFNIPENATVSNTAVIKSDLDSYTFGAVECNWEYLYANGFEASDATLLCCLTSFPHKLRLLCGIPEVRLNSFLLNQVKIQSANPLSQLLLENLAMSISCPLVKHRLKQVEHGQCPAIGLLKWNLWQFDAEAEQAFDFSPANLLEAMSNPQVMLVIPPGRQKALAKAIVMLDEPLGPVQNSALQGQSLVRDWILQLDLDTVSSFKIGSAVQRLLLRFQGPSSWRNFNDWKSFEPRFRKQASEGTEWLERLTPMAVAVVVASLPPSHSADVIVWIASQIDPEVCATVIDATTACTSEFSMLNAALLLEATWESTKALSLQSSDLRNLLLLNEALQNGNLDVLERVIHTAMDSWATSGFKFESLESVTDSVLAVLKHKITGNSSIMDVEIALDYVFGTSSNQDYKHRQKAFCRSLLNILNKDDSTALAAGLWYRAPEAPLPTWVTPTDLCIAMKPARDVQSEHWKSFQDYVTNNTGLVPLAALAICGRHEYLDDRSYENFNTVCTMAWPLLITKTILIAIEPEKHAMVSHTTTITQRSIPPSTLESIGVCAKSFSLRWPFEDDLPKVRFDLTSGVSRTSIQLGLQALVHGRALSKEASQSLKNNGNNCPGDKQLASDQFYLRMLILAWFQSFGIEPNGLPKLMKTEKDSDLVKKVINEMENMKAQSTGNGIWMIAFALATNSSVQLKTSAFKLFGTDADSQSYTSLRLRNCYEACGPCPLQQEREGVTEDLQAGYLTALSFTENHLKDVTKETPLNLKVAPLAQISALCREIKRSFESDNHLRNVITGFVEGCVESSSECPTKIGYGISALALSIGFSTTVSQQCLKIVYEIVTQVQGAVILSTVSNLLGYLTGSTFVMKLPELTGEKVVPITKEEVGKQNIVLMEACKGSNLSLFSKLHELPRPQSFFNLPEVTSHRDANPTSIVSKTVDFFGTRSATVTSDGASNEHVISDSSPPQTVVVDSILSINIVDKDHNPYFIRLQLLNGFSISLIKHTTASGGEGYTLVREIMQNQKVVQKFMTSLDAWRYCCSLAPGSVLVCKGFFLVMSATHELLLYLSRHPLKEQKTPTALHYLATHTILRSHLGEKVGRFLKFLGCLAEQYKNEKVLFKIQKKEQQQDANAEQMHAKVTPSKVEPITYRKPTGPKAPRKGDAEVNIAFIYRDMESTVTDFGESFVSTICSFFSLAHAQRAQPKLNEPKHTPHSLFDSLKAAHRIQEATTQSELDKLNQGSGKLFYQLMADALHEVQDKDTFVRMVFDSNVIDKEPYSTAMATDTALIEAFEEATRSVNDWWGSQDDDNFEIPDDTVRNPLLETRRGVTLIPAGLGRGLTPVTAGTGDCVHILFNNEIDNENGELTAVASHFMYRTPLVELLASGANGGLSVGYLFDTRFLNDVTVSADLIGEFKRWLYFVASAPIPTDIQGWLTGTAVARLHNELREISGTKAEHIIIRCLADRCPLKAERFKMLDTLRMKSADKFPDLDSICERIDSRYGVICVPEVSPSYKAAFATEYLWFDGRTEEEHFLSIFNSFGPNTTHVIVRSEVPVNAPRSLMKWVAEYTEQHPWHFVIFERFNTFECEPELRDRIINRIPPPSTMNRFLHGEVSFSDHLGIQETDSKVNDEIEFKAFIKERITSKAPFVVLLESSPGLGKTFAMKQLETETNINFFRIDASDSRLVTETMLDVLDKTMPFGLEGPTDGVQCALVVDEFHLTRSELKKRELEKWVTPRLGWLKLILIANRTDAVDTEIIDNFQRVITSGNVVQLNAFMTSTVIDNAFGDDDSLRGKTPKMALLKSTLLVLRLIFGAEAASLRLKTQFNSASFIDIKQAVTSVITDKLIMFGDIAPQVVVNHIFNEFANECVPKASDIKGRLLSTQDPMKLISLVCLYSTLVIRHSQPVLVVADGLQNFEQFSAASKLYDFHPIARLRCWLVYILKQCSVEVTKQSEDSILKTLMRMEVMNQDRFPIVLEIKNTASGSLTSAKAVLTEGDFNNPKWMAEIIKSGKQIKWEAVKKEWINNPDLDPVGLSQLISATKKQPSHLIGAFPTGMAFRMLYKNPYMKDLRSLFLDNMSAEEVGADCTFSESSFMMSAWCEVKTQPIGEWRGDPIQRLLDCVGRENVARSICRKYNMCSLSLENEKFVAAALVMRWVSTYISVGECIPDGKLANVCLGRTLSILSNKLYKMNIEAKGLISHLWSGPFAGLILISKEVHVKEAGIVEHVAENEHLGIALSYSLVSEVSTLPPDWPLEMKHLRSIAKNVSTSESTRVVANIIQNNLTTQDPLDDLTALISDFITSPYADEHLSLLRQIICRQGLTVHFRDNADEVTSTIRKNVEKAVLGILEASNIRLNGTLRTEVETQWAMLHKGDVDVVAVENQQLKRR